MDMEKIIIAFLCEGGHKNSFFYTTVHKATPPSLRNLELEIVLFVVVVLPLGGAVGGGGPYYATRHLI